MSIAYLPNVAPPNNNTQQLRRRTNDLVSTVNDSIGSISDNTGDLGSLQTQITALQKQVTALQAIINAGINHTSPLAKLTGGGINGSITYVHGVITAEVDPT
jgi:hypothetical protein